MSLWDNWGDERGCDEGHWHPHTRGHPWGLAEVVGTVQQVHCSRRRLLRRGLNFHVCTINKSAHTKIVWKLIACPSYIYIYMSLCVCVCVCQLGKADQMRTLECLFLRIKKTKQSVVFYQTFIYAYIYIYIYI